MIKINWTGNSISPALRGILKAVMIYEFLPKRLIQVRKMDMLSVSENITNEEDSHVGKEYIHYEKLCRL